MTLLLLVLNCLVQYAAPVPGRKNETLPPTAKSKPKATPTVKPPNTRPKQQTAKPTAKSSATTRRSTERKAAAPTQLKEFSLEEILFVGRQSNEANAFIKANEQRGKTLETTYEHVREQDLNDIEGLVRRRKELESRIQLNI